MVPKKPNVLFILVDDLGYKDLEYTGSSFYETPNINQLASKSFKFNRGYSGSRVCSPSRATIMTGKFSARHGITDWIGAKSGTDWRKAKRHDKMLPANYINNLPQEEITIAEAMKINGYTTFFAGKWHLGDKESLPKPHGFDFNIGGWKSGSPKGGYFSPFKNPKLSDSYHGENLSMRLAKETVQFLKEIKKEPFFAFLSFYAVHGPIQSTEKKWLKYRNKALKQGIQNKGFIMGQTLPIRQKQDNPIYAGLIETLDDAIGVVLNSLNKLQLDKNTIVIFTSDNGGVVSGDGFATSNFPLKGGKGYQWEGGIRVPYFIYVPWSQAKKRKTDYPVTGADFYPTILDYANISLNQDQHKDGFSLKPLMEKDSFLKQRALYWHYPHYGNQGGDPSSIIIKGDWKLIHYYEDGSNELYNLKEDVFEQKNLVKNYPDLSSTLYSNLKNWLISVNAKYPEKDPNFNEEKRKIYENKIENKILPKLEKERMQMLSENFQPNQDWWGSKLTKD